MKIMNLSEKKSFTEKISFLVVLQYSIMTIKNMLASSSMTIQSINSSINLLIIIFLALMYLKLILGNISKINILYKQIFLLLFIAIFWLISYVNNPSLFSYSYLNGEVRGFIAYSLPILLFVPMVTETKTMLKYFYKASYFMCIAAVLAAILSFFDNSSTNIYTSYSMGYGRNAMLPSILLYSKAINQNNKKDFFLATSLVGLIILLGSRFPVLCIMFFLLVKIIFLPRTYKKIMYIFGCVTVAAVTYFNIPLLAKLAIDVLSKVGIQSRTLLLLSLGMGSYSSGRNEIHQQLYEAINQSPIWGYGAGAGTILLDNGLSHGLIIDIFANLGYVLGGLVLLGTLIIIFNAYNKTSDKSGQELLIIIVSNFIPIITIQLGLWSANMFWFSIALSFAVLKISKKTNFNRVGQ
jgi:hypothetical protein